MQIRKIKKKIAKDMVRLCRAEYYIPYARWVASAQAREKLVAEAQARSSQ